MRRFRQAGTALVAASALVVSAGAAPAAPDESAPAQRGPAQAGPAQAASTVPGAASADPQPVLPDAEPVTAQEDVVDLTPASEADVPVDGGAPAAQGAGDQALVAADDTGGELSVVGVTWTGSESDRAVAVELRSRSGQQWSDWDALEVSTPVAPDELDPDAATEDGGVPVLREGTEPMAVLDADTVQVRLTVAGGDEVADAELSVWDPGQSPADSRATLTAGQRSAGTGTTSEQTESATSATRTADSPTIYTRADWGADESKRTWRPRVGQVRGIIVHHTAGINGYSRAQVPAIIRGIYHYHAITRDWGDIGYNVMVDRFGRAWEGRYGGLHRAVIAGHALQYNSETFGISVLGNYEQVPVPDVAMDAVARVSGWKLELHGVPADGTYEFDGRTNAVVQGHRDVAQTLCPGYYFYPRLGELEQDILDHQSDFVPGTSRLSGGNRYHTAAAVSRASHGPNVDSVFIASGQDFPDALAAGPAAARFDAPLLLVRSDGVPQSVVSELERLRPKDIHILGGRSVVSEEVESELEPLASETVDRLKGPNRYATAAEVAGLFDDADRVFVAAGRSFPDALSGGAAAAKVDAPLLLARPDGLGTHAVTRLTELEPSEVVVLGGPGVIDDEVLTDIAEALPDAVVTEHAGKDRYITSARVSAAYWPGGSSRTVLAMGTDYPDALAGTQYAAAHEAPLLLSRRDCMPGAVATERERLISTTTALLGGSASLTDDVVTEVC